MRHMENGLLNSHYRISLGASAFLCAVGSGKYIGDRKTHAEYFPLHLCGCNSSAEARKQTADIMMMNIYLQEA